MFSLVVATVGAVADVTESRGAKTVGILDNGTMFYDVGKERLVAYDILYVQNADSVYLYKIPEIEIPQFATLLYPTNKATEKREYLVQTGKMTVGETQAVFAKGIRPGIIEFTKNVFFDKNSRVHATLGAQLPDRNLSYGYIVALNADVFDSLKFQGKTMDGKTMDGVFNAVFPENEKFGPFASFQASGNGSEFEFTASGATFWILKTYSEQESASYYYLHFDKLEAHSGTQGLLLNISY
jgi:hypothetical protein